MTSRPRVAFLARTPVSDTRAWSGTIGHMAAASERHLGPVVSLGPLPAWPKQVGRATAVLSRALGRGRGLSGHTRMDSIALGRAATRRTEELRPDLVMAPAASVPLASFRADVPVVYLSDATVRLMLGYYPHYSGVGRRAARIADQLEAAAIARADLLIYPTRWAADSAVDDYGAHPDRVAVVPYGANLPSALTDEPPPRRPPSSGTLRLLLIGVDWETKGVDHAVDAVERLRADGVDARLTVIGCRPPGPVPSYVTVVGFVDKSTASGLAAFRGYFEQHDMFLLPSRAEAFGIVLAEAAAFGLPVVARATGGIPEVLPPPDTARTFPEEGAGPELAAAVAELWEQPAMRDGLAIRSRARFESVLNWDAWGTEVARVVSPLLGRSA